MSDDSDEHRDGDYQYRAVFVLGGDWRARPWKDRISAIEDIGAAAEKGAPVTAIERKDTETGQIERAPTPEEEWTPEEETDLKIRVSDEDQQELVTDGGEHTCENCGESSWTDENGQFGGIVCSECGYRPRKVVRDEIRENGEALATDGGEAQATGNYRYGSVVELTMDDPRPDGELVKGDVLIKEGQVEDEIAFTVHHDGRFIDVECEVLETYHADRRMGKDEITQFTAEQAKKDGVPA